MLKYLLPILFSVTFFSCNEVSKRKVDLPTSDEINSLMILSNTSNSADIESNIYHDNHDSILWLHDAFLFSDRYFQKDGVNYDLDWADYTNKSMADKSIWGDYTKNNLADNKTSDILESILDSLVQENKEPEHKLQVLFSIPYPQPNFADWGRVDSVSLDFEKTEYRVKAVIWYIDEVLKLWEEKRYNYLNLAGFHWMHQAVDAELGDNEVIRKVKYYLKNKGLKLLWIPHYGAEGAADWQALGFDIAYQQTNYYEDERVDEHILYDALKQAKENQMGILLNWDERAKQSIFEKRLQTIKSVIANDTIWENRPKAYCGGGY